MIEYAKTILPKMSFSKLLFKKELMKCLSWMKPAEQNELKAWCVKRFNDKYPDVLEEAFRQHRA